MRERTTSNNREYDSPDFDAAQIVSALCIIGSTEPINQAVMSRLQCKALVTAMTFGKTRRT
jgi:hypothetical protein